MKLDIFLISLLVGTLVYPSFSSMNVQTFLSSYAPYASGVTYDFNISGMTNTIPTNSKLVLELFPGDNETTLSLANCKGSISQSSAPTTTSCSLVYDEALQYFTISFNSLITTGGITFLRVQFDFDNIFVDTPNPLIAKIVDQGSSTIEQTTFDFQYLAGTLDGSIATDHDIIAQDYSTIKLTVNSPIHLNPGADITKTKLQIFLVNFVSFAANSSCNVAVGTCTIVSSSVMQITSVGFTLNNLLITMTNVYIPLQQPVVGVAFVYNDYFVANKDISITFYCTSPCKTCGTSITTCLSCLPAPNQLLYLSNGQCLASCPDGTYPNSSNVCVQCVSPCANCIDQTKCSSCIANYSLSGQSCIRSRPNYYFSCYGSTLACMLEIQ